MNNRDKATKLEMASNVCKDHVNTVISPDASNDWLVLQFDHQL